MASRLDMSTGFTRCAAKPRVIAFLAIVFLPVAGQRVRQKVRDNLSELMTPLLEQHQQFGEAVL